MERVRILFAVSICNMRGADADLRRPDHGNPDRPVHPHLDDTIRRIHHVAGGSKHEESHEHADSHNEVVRWRKGLVSLGVSRRAYLYLTAYLNSYIFSANPSRVKRKIESRLVYFRPSFVISFLDINIYIYIFNLERKARNSNLEFCREISRLTNIPIAEDLIRLTRRGWRRFTTIRSRSVFPPQLCPRSNSSLPCSRSIC